jgi:hypothetical protein
MHKLNFIDEFLLKKRWKNKTPLTKNKITTMKKAIFILINIINTTLFGQNVSNKTNRFIVKFNYTTVNPTINQTSHVIFGVSRVDALNEKFGCIAITNLFVSLKKHNFQKHSKCIRPNLNLDN